MMDRCPKPPLRVSRGVSSGVYLLSMGMGYGLRTLYTHPRGTMACREFSHTNSLHLEASC